MDRYKKLEKLVEQGGYCDNIECVGCKFGSDLYCVLVEMDFTDIYERCDRAKLLLREYKLERILKK